MFHELIHICLIASINQFFASNNFYKDHNPSKLGDVDKALAKYAGEEDKLFKALAKRYKVDPCVFGVEVTDGTDGFKSYATANNTFGSLTSPKRTPAFGTLGSSKGDQKSKGRSTITSLKTYTEDLRVKNETEDTMDCD